MKKLYVKIDGIHCNHYESTIKNALLNNNKINEVEFYTNIACISSDEKIDKKKIIEIINGIGYITKDEYINEDIRKLKDSINVKEFIGISLLIILLVFLINRLLGFNVFNAIPVINDSITYGMLLITGILTSIHCISMCGAINLVTVIDKNIKRNFKKPLLYNIGRLLSYTIIGGIVGFIGSIISISSTLFGIIIIISSVLMFLMSLSMFGVLKIKLPRLFKYKSGNRSAFIVGILNGFMPCGPLQAMQVYALSTGSAVKGAISLFLFGIGTFPLMFLMGIIVNFVNGKSKIVINKIATVLIFLLSLFMLNRGLLTLNIDLFAKINNYDNFISSTIVEDYQLVEINLTYDNYGDIVVQRGIPVKMVIYVDKKYLTGCNEKLYINEFNIEKKLKVGKNIIEFMPTESGIYTYSCWMNMIKNNIKVIDDKSYFKENDI